MIKKTLLIGSFLSVSLLLSGCFGGGGEVIEEEETFNEESALTREEKEELDKKYEELLDKASLDIEASDYVINQIMLKDLGKDFYYDGILTMEVDTIYQQQLKYFEVHREYMSYLEKNGATKAELVYNNRKFNTYLETFKGRQIDGKDHLKRAIERYFYKYNVLELETIVEGKSIKDLVSELRTEESDNGMWDWFRAEEQANFKGNILDFTNVTFYLLEPSDNDVIKEYFAKVKEVQGIVSEAYNNPKAPNAIAQLKSILEDVKDERLNEEVEWVRTKVHNYIVNEINKLELYYNKDKFGLAYEEFFVDINIQEVIVSLNLFEENLEAQSDRRKEAKEAKEAEKDSEEE